MSASSISSNPSIGQHYRVSPVSSNGDSADPIEVRVHVSANEVLQAPAIVKHEDVELPEVRQLESTPTPVATYIEITLPSPSNSPPEISPLAAVSNGEAANQISRAARFYKACGSCIDVVSNRFFGVGQYAVLAAASLVGLSLKIHSIKQSKDVLDYTEKSVNDLFHGGVNGAAGDILGIAVLNDLWYAGKYAIGTIVVNSVGLVADLAGSIVYGANVVLAAGGGTHFYELIEKGSNWIIIPLASQTGLNAASIATSWNTTAYLESVVLANDFLGHPLSSTLSADLHHARDSSLVVLAENAASLGMVFGVPLLIYAASKAATSDRVRDTWNAFTNSLCCIR